MAVAMRPGGVPFPEITNNRIGTAPVESSFGPSPMAPQPVDTSSFGDELRQVMHEVNEHAIRASEVQRDYASGKQNDLHGTMITMAEADIKTRLVVQVRNKVIEAYREVMRMGS
ncbi:MAG: flagellar hook-basal body complex protein FliE [Polyangiales bacterium]